MGAVSYHLPDMVASPLLFWYLSARPRPQEWWLSQVYPSLAVLDVLS